MLVLFFGLLPVMSFSQDLHKRLWKNRVLLVLADSYQNPLLIQQLNEFKSKKKDADERKLIIYQITPTSYRIGFERNKIIKDNNLYNHYNPSNEDFKVILIGLDGGIKLEENNFLKSSPIFNEIDQMPMRKQELRTKNN